MIWVGHVARIGDRRGACKVLVGRPEGERPLGSPRLKWQDDIKMDLQEMGWGGMDWIGVVQDTGIWAVVNAVMELSGCIKCGEFLD
jgi:hypothetical protein